MPRVARRALLLALLGCCSRARTQELMCDDMSKILPGRYERGGDGWLFDKPKQYKNRDCRSCDLGKYDDDCVKRDTGEATCPYAPQFDALPPDYEKWICPAQCEAMPTIPYQVSVVKRRFYFTTWSTQYNDERNFLNVPVPSEQRSLNTYDVCPISECKMKRYQDNYNARVNSCWQWHSRSGMPQMAHLDDFFTDGEAHAYDFAGSTQKKYTISQCISSNSFNFQPGPCWVPTVSPEQQNKQFWIKPHYTYYRSRESRSAKEDCRINVVGSYWYGSFRWDMSPINLLQPVYWANEWNINNHWSNPPARREHFYAFKSLFDATTGRFGDFSAREDKTIATWDYTIPCRDESGNQYTIHKLSPRVYYAESGCNDVACVDFVTKPCYDNIYRFDDMVCGLIERVFPNGPIKFHTFKEKIMSTYQREPFMSYGRHEGNSYFDIFYDTTRVQVKRGESILYPDTGPHIFADDHTITVTLAPDFSCKACTDIDLFGRLSPADNPMAFDIIKCRQCRDYEKVEQTNGIRDCVVCGAHKVRNPDAAAECKKCEDVSALTPMRRQNAETKVAVHSVCTKCEHFQYFDISSAAGCIFLRTVADGIKLSGGKALLSENGKDFYISDQKETEIAPKYWRDFKEATSAWNTQLAPRACIPRYVIPTGDVPRLKFTAWCGHREILRHQQAWLQVGESSLYVPLNSDPNRTRTNASVVQLCGTSALTQVSGSTTADLACGAYTFSIIRSGFADACALCVGAKFTDKCWPTYVAGLEVYDDAYFDPANKALTPHPGTCADCNARCDNILQADTYIDPIPYSCWWNGTGRIPGVLGANATNYSWYKPAPCKKCGDVRLTADAAKVVLGCGNRVSYRRWLADTVTGSELDAARSIPSIQTCCVEALPPAAGTLCTDTPAEFETFAQLRCRQTVDDTPPALLPYCPPGWWVERTCATDSPRWNPDCCVRCKPCRGGLFKLDVYKVCPGDEFFDAQDRGCTTKCLTNQYLRNDQCIKCEACE